jgi:uncharacterized protein (DUF2336 family)
MRVFEMPNHLSQADCQQVEEVIELVTDAPAEGVRIDAASSRPYCKAD